MKLFLIRQIKILFIRWRLHIIFRPISGVLLNLFYLTKMSQWAAGNKKNIRNDFPSDWDYQKRFGLYEWVISEEKLSDAPVNYLEFGVAQGTSFRWFLQKNSNVASKFYGFDTFTGLPEDFGAYKKGTFNNNNEIPEVNDGRARFFQGLFQQTMPSFLKELDPTKRMIVMMDADLYSATLYVLASLSPFLKKGDIIFFDEFSVPIHEFKAFDDFRQSFPLNFELIGAANNYYFSAFKVV